jgi:hypothetical protein
MNINSVSSVFVPPHQSSQATSSVQSAAAEAMETAAQTKAEALKGDQQAVRKLARQSTAQAVPTPEPAVPENPSAARGLNATA